MEGPGTELSRKRVDLSMGGAKETVGKIDFSVLLF